MDIGKDYGAAATEDYKTPHGLSTGEISWVHIDIGKDRLKILLEWSMRLLDALSTC